MKRLILPVLSALLVLLSACGKPAASPAEDASERFAAVQAALAASPCTYTRFSVELTLSVGDPGDGALVMETSTETELSVCLDPLSSRSVILSRSSIGSAEDASVMEIYTVPGDGGWRSYTAGDGVWLGSDEFTDAGSVRLAASNVYLSSGPASETDGEHEGRAVRVLTAELTEEEIRSVLVSVFSGFGYEDAELGGAGCTMRLLFDRDTLLPVYQELEFRGIGQPIEAAYAEAGIGAAVTGCRLRQSYLSYDPMPAVRLPEGAAEKAEAWGRLADGNPDNGDGSFTIREGTVTADLLPPEGFTVIDTAYNNIVLASGDDLLLRFSVVCPENGDYLNSEMDEAAASYEESGFAVERTDGAYAANGLDFRVCLLCVRAEDTVSSQGYAWARLADDDYNIYYLFVELLDGCNAEGEAAPASAPLPLSALYACLDGAAPGKLNA